MPVKKKKPTPKKAPKKSSKKKVSKKVDDDFVIETDEGVGEVVEKKKPKKKKAPKKKVVSKKKLVSKKKAAPKKKVKKKASKKVALPPEEEVFEEDVEVEEDTLPEEEQDDDMIVVDEDDEEGAEDDFDEEGEDEEDEEVDEEEAADEEGEDEDDDAFLFDEDEEDVEDDFDEDEEDEVEEDEEEVLSKKKHAKKKKTRATIISDEEGDEGDIEFLEDEEGEDEDDDEPKDIDKELVEIYENTDGSMPDMSQFQKKSRHPFLIAILVLILSVGVLGAAAYVGMQFFGGGSEFSQDDVVVTISGEESVAAGQEVVYKIRYRNTESATLTNASLEVHYPDGFVFDSADPAPTGEKNNVWNVEDVASSSDGTVEVRGRIFGDIDSEHSFRVFLNYTPSNFSSEFQKVATHRVTVASSPLSLAIKGPVEIATGASAEFVFDVEKTENLPDDVGELFLVVEAQDSFEKKESSVGPVEGESLKWPIAFEGGKMSMTLSGSFVPAQDVLEGSLVARVIGVTGEGKEYTYSQMSHSMTFLQTDVSLGVVVNGGQGDLRLQPGDMINTTLVIKNTGGEPVNDVSVSLTFDAPSYDNKSLLKWASVDLSESGGILGKQLDTTTRRGSISWDKADISGLQQLDTGEEITIDVQLPIKTAEDIDLSSFETYDIEIRSEMIYTAAGDSQTVNGNTINAVVNSDLSLEVSEEITTSDDDKDVHAVTWTLSNSLHDVKDAEVTVDVYGDVSIDSDAIVASDGSASFEEGGKQMVWKLDAVPEDADDLTLSFVIVEEKEDPSQTNLTSKVKVKATDSKTGEEIIYLGDPILLLGSGGDEE